MRGPVLQQIRFQSNQTPSLDKSLPGKDFLASQGGFPHDDNAVSQDLAGQMLPNMCSDG